MPQLTQRTGFQQFEARPADIELNQFGIPLPDISQFNSNSQPFQIPQLPLTPTEMSGNPFHNWQGAINSPNLINANFFKMKGLGPSPLELF